MQIIANLFREVAEVEVWQLARIPMRKARSRMAKLRYDLPIFLLVVTQIETLYAFAPLNLKILPTVSRVAIRTKIF